jgi:hypothetical protein
MEHRSGGADCFMVASYAGDEAAFAVAFDGFCATAGLSMS